MIPLFCVMNAYNFTLSNTEVGDYVMFIISDHYVSENLLMELFIINFALSSSRRIMSLMSPAETPL